MKNTIKKVIAILLALSMVSCFAACSAGKKKYSVGICQLVQHEALDAATDGFKKAMQDVLGKDNVEFDFQNAANDSATCATIVNGFVSSGVDLIMANATPALQAAAAATDKIPIVATSITDYATALSIKDWTGKTGKNITGTADLAPLDKQADMIKELVPTAKTVGILYASSEANSKYQATQIEKTLDTLGLKYKEYTMSDSNDISAVTTKAVADSDVLYIPTDNTIASSTGIIDSIALPAKTPVVAGESGICKGCGIATLSISYYDIGYSAGKMAASILKDGKDPADMEVQYSSDLTKQYYASRCKKLGITVPSDYEAIEETTTTTAATTKK